MGTLRPFQIILMSVFGLLALVGLFVFANFSGFGTAKVAVGSVVIWGTLPQDAIETALQDLATAKPEYAKVTYEEKQENTFSTALANALASGKGPDLVILSQEMVTAERGKITVIPFSAIPQRTYLDNFLPIFELFQTSTGTYGVPLAVDPLVLFYNRSILSSAGIASPPTTWEAVAGLAPAITQRTDPGAVTRSLIALGEYSNVRNGRAILSLLFLQAGTSITKMGEQGLRSTLGDEGGTFGTTPAQSAVSFYAQFADPAKTTYSWNRSLPESRAAFLSGDLALYVGFASEQAFIAGANPNLDFDMARVPVPGTLTNRITYGTAYALATTKASANPGGAYAVATALTDPTIDAVVARNLGMVPARKALQNVSADDKYGAVYFPEALVARGWLSPAPTVTDGIFFAMIADITTGRRSVEQALTTASASITAASQ